MCIPKPHPHGELRPRGWLCNYSHGGCGREGNKAISKLHVNKYAGGYSPVWMHKSSRSALHSLGMRGARLSQGKPCPNFTTFQTMPHLLAQAAPSLGGLPLWPPRVRWAAAGRSPAVHSSQRSCNASWMHTACFLHSNHVRVRYIILIAKIRIVFFFAKHFFGMGARCILQIFALEIAKWKSSSVGLGEQHWNETEMQEEKLTKPVWIFSPQNHKSSSHALTSPVISRWVLMDRPEPKLPLLVLSFSLVT